MVEPKKRSEEEVAAEVETEEASDANAGGDEQLPANRFELELEFLQALASPNYLHFLANSRSEATGEPLLQDGAFRSFLRYLLVTWSRPEYVRFLSYPACVYLVEQLLENPVSAKEWSVPAFRNFVHQQLFATWQHRHSANYGVGMRRRSASDDAPPPAVVASVSTAPSGTEEAPSAPTAEKDRPSTPSAAQQAPSSSSSS
jgi:mediator of RNA polymerase II transcription subunit 31